ncbi:MAG TPA: carboxypeptidase regulatory-like domain-containing protein [Candidatus Kapabacteria bacterium]|nr:carboxypeptidase regulatory-like domain-containing protein [Candidatus Kapabacteria bacterium]
MNTRTLRKLSYFLSLLVVVGLISCGGKKSEDENEGGDNGAAGGPGTVATVDMANGATITGTVKLDGAAPANKAIAMDADPVCKSAHSGAVMEDHWITGDGGTLSNAFIYIKDGLGGKTYAAPTTPVTLDQHGCQYEPHVFGILTGQKFVIKNSDKTLHNIHSHGDKNSQFNDGQPPGSPDKEESFDKVEVMVPIKCDVHGWMNCYAGVLNHPFFAVTKNDGKFSIAGVPAGDYTISCWHETVDGKGVSVDQKVTVAAKDSKTVDFTLKAQ